MSKDALNLYADEELLDMDSCQGDRITTLEKGNLRVDLDEVNNVDIKGDRKIPKNVGAYFLRFAASIWFTVLSFFSHVSRKSLSLRD